MSDVAATMSVILGTMMAVLGGLVVLQTPKPASKSSFLPSPKTEPSKYAYEMFTLMYTPFWISCFAIIILMELYEQFDAFAYNAVCLGLALPLLLQPIVFPSAGFSSPDQNRPLLARYSFKANIFIAMLAFMANYWYTHYFYSVLKAKYTMPATRVNNVPIAMYFATHFYFSTYHVFSNALLRKVLTTYEPGLRRRLLFIGVIVVFAYFTAFMETLTISSFPYYSFEDRNMAYTVGSAFYGLYFIVSFPAFIFFDEDVDSTAPDAKKLSSWQAFIDGGGYGIVIMCLLDFVRLYLGIPLIVGELK